MKILASPRASGNPYQELLYAPMRSEGDTIRYLAYPSRSASFNIAIFLPQIIFWRLCGYTVFHLHWVNTFGSRFKHLAYYHYLLCLGTMKFLGYKLVWTAHNALPHEKTFPDDDVAQRKLGNAADLIIAHTPSTIEELKKIGIEPKRYAIIPHGNYIEAYPHTMTRETARTALALQSDDFVYLYLGQIRRYKGIEKLLHAYRDLHESHSKLVIAGKCQNEELKKNLLAESAGANVLWHEGFIADQDLQMYFAAADIVVLPFERITTSGSALLALSFGKAVIVPRLGDLDHLPDAIAYKYSPADKNGLNKAMKQAASNQKMLLDKSKAGLRYVKEFNWLSIALETHNAIEALFIG